MGLSSRSENLARSFERLEEYGPLLPTVIAADIFTHIGIPSRVIGPVVNYIAHLLLDQGIF